MVGKYKVITLCGSTRFKDAFMGEQKRLTLEGTFTENIKVIDQFNKKTCLIEKYFSLQREINAKSTRNQREIRRNSIAKFRFAYKTIDERHVCVLDIMLNHGQTSLLR